MHKSLRQLTLCALGLALGWIPAQAQTPGDEDARAYLRAVADYHHVSLAEIRILGEWDITPQEVPVVLFIARRAGVSPDALAALHGPGASWMDLASRYNIDSADLYVRLSEGAAGTRLARVYEAFSSRPRTEWGSVGLSDPEVVALVNLRFLSSVVGESPDRVLAALRERGTFVQAYQALNGT